MVAIRPTRNCIVTCVLYLALGFLSALVAAQPEECPSQHVTSQSVGSSMFADGTGEAFSLMQVHAKRLQKAAASASAMREGLPPKLGGRVANVQQPMVQVPQRATSTNASETVQLLVDPVVDVPRPATQASFVVLTKERMHTFYSHLQRLRSRLGRVGPIIALLAIAGPLFICLLDLVLYPVVGNRASTPRNGPISQFFPRADRQGCQRSKSPYQDTSTYPHMHKLGISTMTAYPVEEGTGSFKSPHASELYPPSGGRLPKFGADSSARSSQMPPFLGSLQVCSCGNGFADGAQFCRACGSRRPGPQSPRASVANRQPTSQPTSQKVLTATIPRARQLSIGLNSTPHAAPTQGKQEPGPLDHTFGGPRAPKIMGNQVPKRPPLICPMLVLPHCEAFFAVPIDRLVAGANVEILGLSGNALLRSTVKETGTGRTIEIYMSGPRSQLLASVSEPEEYGPKAGMQEIIACVTNKGGRPVNYGWLRPYRKGHILRCGDDDIMTVVTSADTGCCQLYSAGTRELLAQASRSALGEGIFDAEDLEVRVTPGMDAVLALLCVLSSALFGSGPTSFSFPPARVPG